MYIVILLDASFSVRSTVRGSLGYENVGHKVILGLLRKPDVNEYKLTAVIKKRLYMDRSYSRCVNRCVIGYKGQEGVLVTSSRRLQNTLGVVLIPVYI